MAICRSCAECTPGKQKHMEVQFEQNCVCILSANNNKTIVGTSNMIECDAPQTQWKGRTREKEKEKKARRVLFRVGIESDTMIYSFVIEHVRLRREVHR